MLSSEIKDKYCLWLKSINEDEDLVDELKAIKDNEEKIEDAFYKDLSFGTGGLRGIVGSGSNRMNIYTVRKVSLGLANYVNKSFLNNKTIAISYDSRIKSSLFAKTAAEVFASKGIHVFIYKQLMPTPLLSFAVRELKCAAGIMITASHNPSKYNGYKVYGPDGCQITDMAAELISKEMNLVDPFKIKTETFDFYIKNGLIEYISDDVYDSFIEKVKKESVLLGHSKINRDFKIVYTPLNGTGLKPITRILKETGFKNIILVKEQEQPDGLFPTCPFPNPEIKETMVLGMKYAKKNDADLLIATDPDCDRVGIAVKDNNNYKLLTGNEVGCLLLDFICKQRIQNNIMPNHPIAVKTIVTTDLIDAIAKKYNVELISVLTGFKYIGDIIAKLEKNNSESSFILGMEESYGYLTGSYVRDKDAVDGSFMIAEMFAYYKTNGKSLFDRLNELYEEHGYFLNKLETFEFDGSIGTKKITNLMEYFRKNTNSIGKFKIDKVLDYSDGIDGLPKSNVIKYLFNGHTLTIRPSGTEPKIKIYYSIKEKSKEKALETYSAISSFIKNII